MVIKASFRFRSDGGRLGRRSRASLGDQLEQGLLWIGKFLDAFFHKDIFQMLHVDHAIDFDGSILLAGNVVYAVSYQGRVAAMDVATGRKLWQEEVSSYSGVDQGFGNIYVAEESGSVIAFHRNG